MDFLNVSKLNLTHDQNQSISQTRWMFPISFSASSTNPLYPWLFYHQRYGDQKSHQNTKHPITPTILMTLFFITQLLDNCVFCPDLSCKDAERNYLINFINDCDTSELEKILKIGKNVDDPTRNNIIQIIQKYWDCFCKEGACQTILGCEFGKDTGDS